MTIESKGDRLSPGRQFFFMIVVLLVVSPGHCLDLCPSSDKESQESVDESMAAIRATRVGQKYSTLARQTTIVFKPNLHADYFARFVKEKGEKQIQVNSREWMKAPFLKREVVLLHELAHAASNLDNLNLFDYEFHASVIEIEYFFEKANRDCGFFRRFVLDLREIITIMSLQKSIYVDDKFHGKELAERTATFNALWERHHQKKTASFDYLMASRLYQFLRTPGEFFWDIERNYRALPHYTGLQQIDDFITLHAKLLEHLPDEPPDGFYFMIEAKLYPWSIIGQARQALKLGGTNAIRHRIPELEPIYLASLRDRIKTWLTRSKGLRLRGVFNE